MSIRSLPGVMLLMCACCAQAAAPQPREIDAIFARWDHPDTPGCALSVMQDGQPVYRHGYGLASLEQGVPITPQTLFYMASDSKQFTATAIALLAEQGKLSLDDDVRRHVPELPDYGTRITLSELVHHTSGLRDYLSLAELDGIDHQTDTLLPAQALDLIARQRGLDFTPGSTFEYSNTNYLLLALIVQRVSGMSLRQYAQQFIFGPLGMRRTRYYDDATEIVRGRTVGHRIDAQGDYRVVRTNFALVGDGGLLSSVDDLAAWERNFLDNRLGHAGKAALIDTLTTPGKLADGNPIDYGFGLYMTHYRGLPVVTHGGAFIGHKSNILRFPEQRLGIYVLCNAQQAEPSVYAHAVADLYLAGTFTEPKPAPKSKAAAPEPEASPISSQDPLPIQALEGNYSSPELDARYRLQAVAGMPGALSLSVRSLPPMRLIRQADGRYAGDGLSLRFTRGADARVDGLVLDAGDIRGIAFKRTQ